MVRQLLGKFFKKKKSDSHIKSEKSDSTVIESDTKSSTFRIKSIKTNKYLKNITASGKRVLVEDSASSMQFILRKDAESFCVENKLSERFYSIVEEDML